MPIEICDTLQPAAWGYQKSTDGKHRTADEVMKMLDGAREQKANLLLNTGPLPDGAIPPDDEATDEGLDPFDDLPIVKVAVCVGLDSHSLRQARARGNWGSAWAGRVRGRTSLTALASAAMCGGVVPQQPPTMFRKLDSAQSLMCRAMNSGVSS